MNSTGGLVAPVWVTTLVVERGATSCNSPNHPPRTTPQGPTTIYQRAGAGGPSCRPTAPLLLALVALPANQLHTQCGWLPFLPLTHPMRVAGLLVMANPTGRLCPAEATAKAQALGNSRGWTSSGPYPLLLQLCSSAALMLSVDRLVCACLPLPTDSDCCTAAVL